MSIFKNKLPDDLKNIWELTSKLKVHNTPDTSDAWMRLEQRLDIEQNVLSKVQSRRLFPIIQPRLVYAFTILFIFILLAPTFYDKIFNISIYADRGSQKELILADGTIIRINAESSLKYNRGYNKESRLVNLYGEGYFQVEKGLSLIHI